MTKDLIGRFYFKRTSNSNLIGEFSNNKPPDKIFTECANLINKTDAINFIGKYRSTWQENDEPKLAELIIDFKPNTNNKIYTLLWKDKEVVIYWGEGMTCDDILIGDYRNFEKI